MYTPEQVEWFRGNGRVWYCTPYDHTGRKDLGAAYNEEMSWHPEHDWKVLMDYDVMFLSPNYYDLVRRYIQMGMEQGYGLLTVMTNRIGCAHQRVQDPPGGPGCHDIIAHRRYAAQLAAAPMSIRDVTFEFPFISGLVMATNPYAWNMAGGFTDGFFVDNDFHARMARTGLKVGIMSTVYVYHFYRGDGDLGHLPRNADGTPKLNTNKPRRPRPPKGARP